MTQVKKSHVGFRIDGIEPSQDIAWVLAGPKGQRAFWQEVARWGLKVKDESIRKGLDIYGEPLKPISERTRNNRVSAMGKAYRNAPPLTPAYGKSRTRSYLRAIVEKDGVYIQWRFDRRIGNSWGVILRHQAGQGRNVIGLSVEDLDSIYDHAMRWWRTYRKKFAIAGATEAVTPKVVARFNNAPPPKPIPAPVPSQPLTVRFTPVVAPIARPKAATPATTRNVVDQFAQMIRSTTTTPKLPDLRDFVMHTGSQSQIRRSIANGTFSGFRSGPGAATSGPFVRKKKVVNR
jgi:hypothetical protein